MVKNIRIILGVVAVVTAIATVIVAGVFTITWAIGVATIGILSTVLLQGYAQMKTLQVVNQRLSGLQKQSDRTATALERLGSENYDDGSFKIPRQVRDAFEDLTLASRSLTVPQVHFDQLLRTISANTIRTEAALDDAMDEMTEVVNRLGTSAVNAKEHEGQEK